VQVYDIMGAYRPETLATHKDFEPYYRVGALFPAKSVETGTEIAAEPLAQTSAPKAAV
jgi:hypothetical protein